MSNPTHTYHMSIDIPVGADDEEQICAFVAAYMRNFAMRDDDNERVFVDGELAGTVEIERH